MAQYLRNACKGLPHDFTSYNQKWPQEGHVNWSSSSIISKIQVN